MKIRLSQIPPEGVVLREVTSARELDLETEIVSFNAPLTIVATVERITNAVTVRARVSGSRRFFCSRCLEEFDSALHKILTVSYRVSPSDRMLDIGPDIREEIILDYPLQPLCSPQCKGLCARCGENLNKGGCRCATTKEKTL